VYYSHWLGLPDVFCSRRSVPTDRLDEPVAAAVKGLNEARVLGIVAEGLA
jgi:hypothetical protein